MKSYALVISLLSLTLFLGGCNMGVFKTETECLKKLIEISRNGI